MGVRPYACRLRRGLFSVLLSIPVLAGFTGEAQAQVSPATVTPNFVCQGETKDLAISGTAPFSIVNYSVGSNSAGTRGTDWKALNSDGTERTQNNIIRLTGLSGTYSTTLRVQNISADGTITLTAFNASTITIYFRSSTHADCAATDGVTVSETTLALTELGTSSTIKKTYTMKLDTDPGADVTITVSNGDATAVEVDTDSGMAGNQNTLTFTHGNAGNWGTTQTVTVRALNDGDAANETVTLTHAATVTNTSNPYHGIAISDVTVTTADAGHGVIVSEVSLSVAENDDTGTYMLRLKSQPGGTVTITATSSMTSKATVNGPFSFNNSNWDTDKTVTVTGKDDGSSTISHRVTGPTANYPTSTTIPSVSVTVTAVNNVPTVANAIPDQTATVGTMFSYQFPTSTFNDADNDSLTYSALKSDGSALPTWLTFAPNNRTFSGTPQSTETVSVKVTADDSNGGSVSDTFDIVVSAAPTLPVITIAPKSNAAITEGGNAVFTVTADTAPSSNLAVKLTVEDAPNSDFVSSANEGTGKTVTITSGSTTADFTVATVGDSADEPNGPVKVTVTNGTDYTVGSPSSASITVNDNDATSVTLTGNTDAVNEGATKTFTVAIGRGLYNGEKLAIPLSFAGQATRGTSGDYTLACASTTGVTCASMNSGTATVTFTGPNTGQSATSVTITLTARSDGTTESGGETVDIGLGSVTATGTTATTTDSFGQFTINDPPAAPVVQFAAASSNPAESAGTSNVMVNLNPAAPVGGLTLTYNVTGTATAGSGNDFTIQSSGTLSVSVGDTTAMIPVVINDDSVDDDDETVVLTLTPGTGYTLGSTTVHTLTIADNDDPPATPTLSVSISPTSANEGNSGSAYATVTITLSESRSQTTEFKACLGASSTATRGATADYQLVNFGNDDPLSLTNGCHDYTISATKTQSQVRLLIRGDTDVESNETIVVELRDPPQGVLISSTDGSATYTILNDDTGTTPPTTPVVQFASNSSSFNESAGTSNIRVNLNPAAPSGGLTLSYTVTGSATAGSDYTIQSSGSVSVPANAASVNIPVVIIDDNMDENNETVILTLTDNADYDLGSTTIHTLTIIDNDDTPTTPSSGGGGGGSSPSSAPVPVINISGGEGVDEGETLVFTIRTETSVTQDTQVKITVEQTGEYTETGERTVTIKAGDKEAVYEAATTDDSIDEQDGEVTVTVLSGTGYEVGEASSVSLEVRDNDQAGVKVSEVSVKAHVGGSVSYGVALTSEPISEVRIKPVPNNSNVVKASEVLVFTEKNWNEEQRVTLTGYEHGSTKIEHEVTSEDSMYAALEPMPEVEVDVEDTEMIRGAGQWLGRFGRTVAERVVEAVSTRMEGGREGGVEIAGGYPVKKRSEGIWEEQEQRSTEVEDVLLGSLFEVGRRDSAVFWANAQRSSFSGNNASFTGDGEITMGMGGVDWEGESFLLGIMIIRANGDGEYGSNEVESYLTAAVPYAGGRITDNLSVWGAAGAGVGEMRVKTEGSSRWSTDIGWKMASGGIRGDIVKRERLGLALVSDVLWARSESEDLIDDVSVSRIRAGVEGTWKARLGENALFIPRVEAGMRRDGGDAERGFGAELGGGVKLTHTDIGLTLDIGGRGVVSHEDGGFESRGISASLEWEKEMGGNGPSLALRQQWGEPESGGIESLFYDGGFEETEISSYASRLSAEAEYGFTGEGMRQSPYVDYGQWEEGRDYALGWRVSTLSEDVSVDVNATRRESEQTDTEHGVGVRLDVRW